MNILVLCSGEILYEFISSEKNIEILRFASASSAIVASRIGAAKSILYFDEVKDF